MWEYERKIRATAAAAVRHLWIFRFRVIGKKGCQRQAVAGFFRGLVSFSLRNFSAFTHDVYSQKPFVPKRKKKNIKKETELYYSMPLCPL